MENCWGLFGEGKKFDSSIFEVGLSASISGIVFNLIRISIFCNVSFCKSMHFK